MKGSHIKVLNGKFHNLKPVGKPSTICEDVIWRKTSQILGIQGWRRRAEDREEWRHLLRKPRAQKELQHYTWIGIHNFID